MTPPSSILTHNRERSSALAWGSLGLLAVSQLGLLIWLLTAKSPEMAESAREVPPLPGLASTGTRKPVPEPGQFISPPPAPPTTPAAPVVPVSSTTAPPPVGTFGKAAPIPPAAAGKEPPPALPGSGMQPPPIPDFSKLPATAEPPPELPGAGRPRPKDLPKGLDGTQSLPGSAQAPAMPPAPAGAVDARRDVNALLAAAKDLRTAGNTQEALQTLQQADLVAPNHPAVMAETAEVYEQMGLNAKAVDMWRGIQLQGAAKAGQFFDLALRRLGNVPGADSVAAPSIGSPPTSESDKRLRLGACEIKRDFSANAGGERYLLRVPIQRTGSKSIDPNAIDLKTFFYYRHNGAAQLDNTSELVEAWQTQPVNWQGTDLEIVDIVYTLPPPTPQEAAQRNPKTYHGYMLHLYYDNKLQDVAAEPRDLLDQAKLSVPGAVMPGNSPNPLLPPVARP
ncbi:MAG: tetratricopeptide repeat protein [Prosthecobacter sp.]